MSRFGGDYEDPGYPNAGELWMANVNRAVAGRRGQRVLRDLLAALEAMPDHRLVEGHLVKQGDVCAVGAYVVHRQVVEGKPREQAVRELALEHARCQCWHDMGSHGEDGIGPCGVCAQRVAEAEKAAAEGNPYRWTPRRCDSFTWPDIDDSDVDEWETADVGRQAGLTTALAWRLAYLNDEELAGLSAEERWERTVAWIRRELREPVAPSAVGGTDG